MPKDPVCGHYVDKSTPYQREYDGAMYYFCCADCMEEYAYALEYNEELDEEPVELKER